MDSVASSLGPTWRSSEDGVAVPTQTCSACEARTVPTSAKALWGQNRAWLSWGWDKCWLLPEKFFQKE